MIAGVPPKDYADYGDKRCMKLTVSVTGTGTEFTRTSRVSYFLDDKPKSKEMISQACKPEKSATTYTVYKKDGDDKWSSEFFLFCFLLHTRITRIIVDWKS